MIMGRVPLPPQLWAGQAAPESSPASCHWRRTRLGGVTGDPCQGFQLGRELGSSPSLDATPTQAPPQQLLPAPGEQLQTKFLIPSLADSCGLSCLVAGT